MKALTQSYFNMKIIKDLGMKYPTINSKIKQRYAIFKCNKCKKNFEGNVYNAKKRKQKKCLTCTKKIGSRKKTQDGLSKHKLASIRHSMINRCYKEKNPSYKNYGKRGIKVCKEWKDSLHAFYTWAYENGYKNGLTLDRRNNNKGYNPNNCRWISMTIQNQNTSILRSTNTTGYRGVSKNKFTNKYYTRIMVKGKCIQLGTYKTAEEAGLIYNKYVIDNDLEHSINIICVLKD